MKVTAGGKAGRLGEASAKGGESQGGEGSGSEARRGKARGEETRRERPGEPRGTARGGGEAEARPIKYLRTSRMKMIH